MTVVRFPIAHLIGDRDPAVIAADLAVTARTVERWIANGIGDWETADRFACMVLNLNPLFAFGPAWAAAAGYPHLASIEDLADHATAIPRPAAPGQLSLLDV